MKCPKCGFDNGPDANFCDECGWQLNMRYGGEKVAVNAVYFAFLSAVLGAIALVCAFLLKVPLGGVVTGGIGMFLGGYSQSYIRMSRVGGDIGKRLVVVALLGILLSVVGFVYSFSKLSF